MKKILDNFPIFSEQETSFAEKKKHNIGHKRRATYGKIDLIINKLL